MITIGIDPHKSSLTAVALQPTGEVAATIRLQVNSDAVARLRAWAERWPQRQWAVEGAAGLGRGVAQGLAAADEPVVDVSAQLAARARLLNTGHARCPCGCREPCHVMRQCRYSCIRPPSRSRRNGRMAASERGGVSPTGGR